MDTKLVEFDGNMMHRHKMINKSHLCRDPMTTGFNIPTICLSQLNCPAQSIKHIFSPIQRTTSQATKQITNLLMFLMSNFQLVIHKQPEKHASERNPKKERRRDTIGSGTFMQCNITWTMPKILKVAQPIRSEPNARG
ncbi:hypothetical protein L6164_009423 [Bauhinia variegata]|uniref:Uncharacterized protein n=1 Tax=Bauhinia variegata TaxID=167791 RepID=A0ACB9PML8_BAUVA|nr:hypothetical protein L6164_009423 [Bauhinia variegata]